MERSIDLIVALVGILRAGAAFMPVDVKYPPTRISQMVADSGARIVIMQRTSDPNVAPGGCRAVFMDELGISATRDASRRLPAPQPRDLAYVMYTSGTTGKPKGVMIEHGALANRLASMQEVLPLLAQDVFLQRTSLCFDPSVEEIFWTLGVGARLVLADPRFDADRNYLASLIDAKGVTFIDCVPTMLEQLLRTPAFLGGRTLRWVLCGGEALSASAAELFRLKLPNVGLCNLYGPTEATISALYWIARPLQAGRVPPIGRPLPGTQAYIFDRQGGEVEPGVRGELYLGGDALARGYLNLPSETAQRFVTMPGSTDRLYKTGDVASVCSDGELEFHGRADRQVKVRGVRVELGEVESCLHALEGVLQAVVELESDECSRQRLVAYVVLEGNVALSRLRSQTRELLPSVMVPSQFVALSAFPMRANGKIDYLALHAEVGPARPIVPPNSETEHAAAQIWERVLRVEQIGLDDDFFELGGDSLLAVDVCSELSSAFGVDVPGHILFETQTLWRLAQWIDNARFKKTELLEREVSKQAERVAGVAPNIVRLCGASDDEESATAPLFCLHAGDGGISPYMPLAKALEDNLPVYGICAWDLRARQLPAATLADLATSYLEQLLRAHKRGPYRLAGWSLGALIAWEMARQLKERDLPVGYVGLIDPWAPWHDAARSEAPSADEELRFFLTMFSFDQACKIASEPSFWALPSRDRFTELARELRQAGVVSSRLSSDDLEYVFDSTARILRAGSSYYPCALDVDVDVFVPHFGPMGDYNGAFWKGRTTGNCRVFQVAGDHLSMMRRPNVSIIGQAICERLATAAPGRP